MNKALLAEKQKLEIDCKQLEANWKKFATDCTKLETEKENLGNDCKKLKTENDRVITQNEQLLSNLEGGKCGFRLAFTYADGLYHSNEEPGIDPIRSRLKTRGFRT